MEITTSKFEETRCFNCNNSFKSNSPNSKYCSDFCSKEYRTTKKISVGNKEQEILKLSEIPINFVLNNITPYQKTAIEIKYHIQMQAELWKGKKFDLYENLAVELNLSFERIRKIAKE